MEVALVVTKRTDKSELVARALFKLTGTRAEKFLICPPKMVGKVTGQEFIEKERMNFIEIYLDQEVDNEIAERVVDFGKERGIKKLFLLSIKIRQAGQSKISPGTIIPIPVFYN